jgi:hypothetical protein
VSPDRPIREAMWFWWSLTTTRLSVPLVILGVVVSLQNATFAEPYWLDLTSKSTTSLVFLAPGFAALAAWDAARWRVLRTNPVRGPLSTLGATLLMSVVASLGTYVVTLAILATRYRPEVGGPHVPLLATVLLSGAAYACFGYTLGSYLPRLYAAGLAFGVTWFWVAYTPAVTPFWLRNVTGSFGGSCCDDDQVLTGHALLAPVTMALALVGACLVLLLARRVISVAAVAGLGLLVAGTATAAHLAGDFGADPVTARTGERVCISHRTGTGPATFCAWPEHETALRARADSLGRAVSLARAAGLTIPPRLVEGRPTSDGWTFSLGDASPRVETLTLASSPLVGLPPACVNRGQPWPAGDLFEEVHAWLLHAVGVPPSEARELASVDDTRAFKTVLGRSRAEQLEWYRQSLAGMRTCGKPS